MLKKLRHKKTAKKVWIILAILIMPAFVLWGSGSIIRSKQEAAYKGKIFGRKISFLEFRDAIDAVRIQGIMRFGDNFSEVEKYLNLESQAWERLILLYEAKRRKINASDKEVVETIDNYSFFQRQGQFDNKIYNEILRYVFRLKPRMFEEQTRQNIILSKLYQQATEGIKINEEEVKQEYRKANEEISTYYIASLASDFTKGLTPSEDELKDYFTKNSSDFKQPLSFNMDYIALESEEKTRDAVLRLNRSNDFEKAAKDMGLTLKETGLFTQADPIPGIGWSPEISSLISKLEPGQYSQPIRADKYYYILRLKERKEAYIPDFEKTKDKVKEKFIKEQSTKLAKEKIDACLKKLKEQYQPGIKPADFEKTAKEFGLKSDATNLFKYGSYIEGIGASDNLWTAALKLKEEEFSDVISMPSGFYIIKVKTRNPIDEKKFEKEKAELAKNLLLEKKQGYFTGFLEELKRKAQ